MGWRIVRHSFILIFGNLSEALRVSLGPIFLGALVILAVFVAADVSPLALIGTAEGGGPATAQVPALPILVLIATSLFVACWIAVGWHRFILLEEYPGLLPRLEAGRVLGYLWMSVVLTVLLLLLAMPVLFLLAAGAGGSAAVAIALTSLMGLGFTYVWLRLALVLPGVAVGAPLGIAGAWAASAPLSGPILSAALIVVGLNLLAGTITQAAFGAGGVAALVDLLTTWITLMVGTSLLTTLYGHLIEGRALP